MKKITKKVIALMLSLVMMLGCIPSNIAHAEGDNLVITYGKNSYDIGESIPSGDPVLVGTDALELDDYEIIKIVDGAPSYEVDDTFTEPGLYFININYMYSGTYDVNSITLNDIALAESAEELNAMNITKDTALYYNDEYGGYGELKIYFGFEIEEDTPGPKTTPIMTAETGGDDTGLTLTGTKAAVYGEDYTVGTLVGGKTIFIETSGWKLSGEINTDVFTGSKAQIYTGENLPTNDMNLIIGDINNNGKKIYLNAHSDKNVNVTFDITKPLDLAMLNIIRSATPGNNATITLNKDCPITVGQMALTASAGDVIIMGPGQLNVTENVQSACLNGKFIFDNSIFNAQIEDGMPIIEMSSGGIEIKNDSKFIAISKDCTNPEGFSCGVAMFESGGINVDDTSEFFASGNEYAVMYDNSNLISNLNAFKGSKNQIEYENKTTLTNGIEETEVPDLGISVKIKDSDPVAYAKTIYKKVCEPISEIEILDNGTFDSTEFYFKTPDDANYEIDKYDTDYWYTYSDCTDVASNITEETTYYTQLKVTPKTGYKFGKPSAASVENGYISNVSSYTDTEIILTIAKTAKSNKTLNLFHEEIKTKRDLMHVYSIFEEGPNSSILNVISPDGTTINGITIPGIAGGEKHFGKYGLQLRIKPSEYYSDRAEFSNITKIIINGTEYSFTKKPEDIQNEEDEYNYLFGQNVIVVENKSTVKVEEDGQQNTDNLVPSIKIFEIFDFNKNDGEIIFSGITPGCLITDVTTDGNLMSDVLGGIEVLEYSEGDWIGPTTPKFEEGKQYRIKSTLIDSDYEYKKIKINGTTFAAGIKNNTYPNESGYNYAYSNADGSFKMFVTYDFISQTPSSGSSKKYKATDTKDTAEKISGSGKKGSTRTIVPEEGRKVANVVVTDKNGNKIDVKKNADGTYSFVQPAENVNVEVTYKNREITLNIGSTEASVDGERENLDVCPVIRNDRTMLPIRFVAENLGAKVEWSEKNPNYVVITRGDTKIEISLGSDIMKVNGKDVKLDSVAFAENDRTYLPVRAVSEALNAIVEWHENEPNVVRIYERQ